MLRHETLTKGIALKEMDGWMDGWIQQLFNGFPFCFSQQNKVEVIFLNFLNVYPVTVKFPPPLLLKTRSDKDFLNN
jgi:hypothetical protein